MVVAFVRHPKSILLRRLEASGEKLNAPQSGRGKSGKSAE
jgi:hypothetical protein